MAKKEKIVLTQAQRSMGSRMNAFAADTAKVLAPALQSDLDRLLIAKQDWEGGKFAVMFRLTQNMTGPQLDALPDPKAKDGNNPAHYFAVRIVDGKEKTEEVYFYEQLAAEFPANRAKGLRIDQLKRSMQDASKVNTSDIGSDIMNMSPNYRHGEIKRLQDEITSSVNSVKGAFELFHQLRKFQELKHVKVELLYKLGPDNLPLDGQEGRGLEIEPTKTPIVITSTIAGRAAIDVARVGIGTFLKYDVDKAKENHGTWQAVIDTVKREKSDDNGNQNEGNSSVPQMIRTADTALARFIDLHEFASFAWDEKDGKLIDALKKAANGEGSDDTFVTLMALKRFLNDVVPDSPRNVQRYKEALTKEADAA